MATALKERMRGGHLGSHRGSSAVQQESICTRCGGLMVSDFFMDLLNSAGELKFAAKRCIQCGEVVDPIILRNREIRQEPMAVASAGVLNI